MKRFKNILCHYTKTDGTAAFDRAVRLARENRAKLTVVEVIHALPRKYGSEKAPAIKELYDKTLTGSQNHLEQIIKPWRKRGIRVRCKVLKGIPFLEIIRKVLCDKHDLVITAVETQKKFKEMVFGTTAVRLIRKCPCPVWAIKSTQTKSFRRIIAAVDPDPDDAGKTALNKKIIELASSLAEMEKSELEVVHCWSKYPELLLGFGYSDIPPTQVNCILRDAKKLHKKLLDEFMNTISLKRGHCQQKLLAGDPGIQIPKMAKREKADLIVMGTVCRVGIPGLLIGNTTEKVLDLVNCSLLTVKPDGFITPIKPSK